MEKRIVRKQFLDCRRQLDLSNCVRLGQKIQQRLIESDYFKRAKSLALYSPINNEVATEQVFLTARELNKQVCYPQVVGEDLEFFEISSLDELKIGTFGVAEPEGRNSKLLTDIDLIIVPGVAFDLRGHRIGYGRGFYDRWLAGKTTELVSVGFCFNIQLCELLPTEDNDQALNYIVTETTFIPGRI